MDPIKEALTFDDVTLAPNYSEILPSQTNTSIKLSKYLSLKIPIMSSAMDTVTEAKMAIAVGEKGGIGVIHRNLSVKKQIQEIRKTKSKNSHFSEKSLWLRSTDNFFGKNPRGYEVREKSAPRLY